MAIATSDPKNQLPREPDPAFWCGKQVCVTGGTGFLGYPIVRQLVGLGARVRSLALPPATAHPLLGQSKVVNVFGDVRDPEVVARAVAGCEVIFHTAGVVAAWGPALERMHSVHVEGTRVVLAAAEPDARLVHTSSIVAVGASCTPQPLDEDSPFGLDDLAVDYVHAKRAAEQLALAAAAGGRHVVVTNPGYLVGPEDFERSIMGRFCVRFWKGRIPIAPPGGYNLVDVRDVARGHLLAAQFGQPGRRYILGGFNHTFREFMARLAEAAGMSPRAIPGVPWWTLGAAAGLAECRAWLVGREPYPALQHVRLNRYYWFCRSDRAAAELGYRCRPLAESLADTYRWHASHGAVRLRGINRWWMRPRPELAAA
jgi:dihydroflavonol-4-reductase